MVELTEQEIRCKNLFKIYNESESRIKSEAMVNRAYIDKTSQTTIAEKVNAQTNSIKAEINNINPRFKEGSKNYDTTEKLITETLENYENVLIELSQFYDRKIEQLILRKVELEASLMGAILNEEYLANKILKKSNQKENDKVKKSVKENIKNVLEKLKFKKENKKEVDPKMITNMIDGQDIAVELEQKLTDRVEKTIQDKNSNKGFISNVEKEILMINTEIDRINERKKKAIYDAMEAGNKELSINICKPRMFKKITRFFISRFNTARVIQTSIIDPLNLRIESFKNNELVSMKG